MKRFLIDRVPLLLALALLVFVRPVDAKEPWQIDETREEEALEEPVVLSLLSVIALSPSGIAAMIVADDVVHPRGWAPTPWLTLSERHWNALPRDKQLHAEVEWRLGLLWGTVFMTPRGDLPTWARLTGAGYMCLAPGVGKEVLDELEGRGADAEDLAADLAGCVVGVGVGAAIGTSVRYVIYPTPSSVVLAVTFGGPQ